MPTHVLMPQLGESVNEGTLSKWLKREGETVAEYEPLMEVNTDKVDTEIPAPASGVILKLLVAEGTVVKAGTPLAVIGAPGEVVASGTAPLPSVVSSAPAPVAVSPAAPAPKRDLGFISPVVAKMADEHQIDLRLVPGTGDKGRITKKDILDYLTHRPAETPQPAPPPAPLTTYQLPPAPNPQSPISNPPDDFIPVVGLRKLIAEHMVRSKHTSPHVTTVFEADMSKVIAHREANKALFARDGVNLTFTAYFVMAVVAGLKHYPVVNSQWGEDKIILKRDINIGMAAAIDDGLIVPVIKNADEKSLLRVAREVNDLALRARGKALKPDEVTGGTFTITNHGVSGSLFATPIINQPQVGILGVGQMQKRVMVINDAIAIRPMVYISLTFDHRILDGAIADHFLAKVKETLEGWG